MVFPAQLSSATATRAMVLFAAAVLLAAAVPALSDQATQRIVVVGDVEGSFDSVVSLLKLAGLVDDQLQWIGGDSILVQTGDLLDGGVRVGEVLDLFMRLKAEAPASGGRVYVLLGNHEAMNILGELRDVNYETYQTFADEGSAARQDEAFRAHLAWLCARAEALGTGEPTISDELKAEWLATHPLGYAEYVQSMAADGRYGRWLRGLPAAIQIGELLFVHGGISPAMQDMNVEAINRRIRGEIARFDEYRRLMVEAGLVLPLATAREMVHAVEEEVHHINALDPGKRDRDRVRRVVQVQDVTGWGSWHLLSEDGPLWFRGASKWDQSERGAEMAALLDGAGVGRLITGQSSDNGRIEARFGGRVLLASTGMSDEPWVKRTPGCLEIESGTMSAIYAAGERQVLAGDLQEQAQ